MSSKKLAMSDKLSICVRTLHQVGKVPVAEMMDHKKYPNLAQFPVQHYFDTQRKAWMMTAMTVAILTREDHV